MVVHIHHGDLLKKVKNLFFSTSESQRIGLEIFSTPVGFRLSEIKGFLFSFNKKSTLLFMMTRNNDADKK